MKDYKYIKQSTIEKHAFSLINILLTTRNEILLKIVPLKARCKIKFIFDYF